ncbi:hypothetical protein PINS_up023064 [Pythium insidiosum]|nr:hypothetical protein PINS_up023064 [Pythium insidiosum]
MFIDAIMDKLADKIYVDHLSRLLVDVDLDSSKIINDLLSPHQRSLMDMLFMDDARSRNKFSLITGARHRAGAACARVHGTAVNVRTTQADPRRDPLGVRPQRPKTRSSSAVTACCCWTERARA